MTILALDPGSKCGWAVWTAGGVASSGVWDIRPKRGDSPGMRYLYLRQRLIAVLGAYPDLRLIAYEQAHQRGGAATEYGIGCATEIQSWCALRGIDHTQVHSSKVKTTATDKGNAGKPAMLAAAERRWPGYEFASDDEVDARWIAVWAAREAGA